MKLDQSSIQKFAYTLILLLFGCIAHAQLAIDGTVYEGSYRLDNASVIVFENGSKVNTVSTGGNGRFDLELELDKEYELEFAKDGYVSKIIKVDTRNVPEEDRKGGAFVYGKWKVELFSKDLILNTDILKKPIGVVTYNPTYMQFANDTKYTNSIKRELDQLMKDLEDARRQEEMLEEQLEEDYFLAVKDGDAFYKEGDLENALFQYKAALKLKPGESYPTKMITKVQEEMGNMAEVEEQYAALLTQADDAFYAENYEEAISFYQDALTLKPKESYPSDQIKLAEDKVKEQAAEAEKRKEYEELVAQADQQFTGKDYTTSKANYERALKLYPDETHPKDQILKIDQALADQEAKEEQFQAALQAGEDALKSKDYELAETKFKEAQTLNPAATRPPSALEEIAALIAADLAAQKEKEAALAAKEESYKQAIAAADAAFTGEDYPTAKAKYNEALEIKAEETYPQEQITKIDGILADQADAEAKYEALIAQAETDLKSENYEAAKSGFQEAATIKPNASRPPEAIAEIDAAISALAAAKAEKEAADAARLAEIDKNYQEAISAGDAAFSSTDYTTAQTKYNEALGIKPEETYPQTKLDEIAGILAQQADAEEKYNALLAQAESDLQAKNYDAAKSGFQQAATMKPNASRPPEAIAEIDSAVAALAAAEAEATAAEAEKLAALNKQYQEAITAADNAFESEDYTTAQAKYNEALGIKSGETYPQTKLDEIAGILAQQADAEAQYESLLAKAESDLQAKNYDAAKSGFQQAAAMKPNANRPPEAIAEIDAALAALAASEAEAAAAEAERLAALSKQYQEAITAADNALNSEDYTTAQAKYNEALGLKPGEAYPQTKLDEIAGILAQQADAEAQYESLLAKAESDLQAKNYDAAKSGFQQAASMKPDANRPPEAIAEIDAALAALAASEAEAAAAEAERLAALSKQYQEAITAADNALNSEDYTTAQAKYNEALGLKPDESYPKNQLAKITSILGDQAKLEQDYQAALQNGESLLKATKYEEARNAFNLALEYKPEATRPKEAIAEINGLLEAQAAALLAKQEKEAAELAALNEAYNQLISSGDQEFSAENYQKALTYYQQAQEKKPEESYPAMKINEINQIISDNKALEASYNTAIQEGDQFFKAKSWDDAKRRYQAALEIKPEEAYPNAQIAKIDAELAALAAAEEARLEAEKQKQAEIDARYQALVQEGDDQFTAEQYITAKEKFEAALSVKPNETYPQGKIDEINTKLGEIAAAEEAAKQKALEEKQRREKYQMLVDNGDALFRTKEWENAKSKYNEALAMYPEEAYPQDQINRIDTQLKAIAEKEEAERLAREEQERIDSEYNEAIRTGATAMSNKDYEAAKTAYTQAQTLKPQEVVPRQKLTEIAGIEAELARIAEEKRLAEEKAAADQVKYDDFMTTANAAFDAKKYEEAKTNYENASNIKPDASEPKTQLNKINQILEEQRKAAAANAKTDTEFNYELARNFPEGRSEKTYEEGNKTVTQVVIVTGNRGDEYLHEKYSWGQEFYLKNKKPYNKINWLKETKK